MKRYSVFLIVIPVVFYTSVYSTENNFIRQFISPGDLVFDVGANIGLLTTKYVNLGATVVCFEPQPDCAETLRKKFKNNPVYIEEKGLADKPGTLTLAICKTANTISTFSDEWQSENGRFYSQFGARWNDHIQVEVDTLDAMIACYGCPAFCKIDVENFEYEVLAGLTQPIPVLSFEFAIEVLHNTKKCVNHLVSLGYRKFNFAIADQNFALVDWVSAEEVMDAIEQASHERSLLWGDVYAQFDV